MKRIFTIIALALSISTITQAQKSKIPAECEDMPVFPYSPVYNTIVYSQVIEVQGKTQTELYDLTRVWYATLFKNPQNGIVFEDTQVKGKLITNSSMDSRLTDAKINFTLDFTFKDGKMKAEVKGISLEFPQAKETRSFEWYIQSTSEKGVKQMKGLRCDVVKEVDSNIKLMLETIEIQINNSTTQDSF